MSNKASPKKHGMVDANLLRPKTKVRKRAPKARARARQIERQTALREAVAKSGK